MLFNFLLWVIVLSKMKNLNIRKYAEIAVRGSNPKTSNTVTKVLRIAYWLVAMVTIVTCLTMMMGNLVWMSEYKDAQNADQLALYYEHRNYFIIMLVSVFSIVSSFFLLRYKLCIPFAVTGCVACVLIFSTFYTVSNANEFMTGPSDNFWIMAIPSILCAVLSVTLGVMIFVTYKSRIPKAYDKIIYDLYQAHTKNGENPLNPDEFEKICDAYKGEEIFRTDIPLKKSQKRRKQKQEEQ